MLDENEIFLYLHSDGFTARHLSVVLTVDKLYNYFAQIQYYHQRQGKDELHEHVVANPLPPTAAQAITTLLAQPGFLQLPSRYSAYWDDLGARFVVGKTAAGIHRIEVEEPFGRLLRGVDTGHAVSEAETALLDVRTACDQLVTELYESTLSLP
ncbi:hypothetical protein DNI29_17320 [Hymenobacter sediminis]|uniref:hypothetical protein n=1 Tax=Hymenobacter sediminis TaxID=2218621 RepID=UPI000DA6930E|nr:hypothetical protein [Hymenobacter sediminis]RPD45908.1 hypothetical protein DNI29_17320 [Hymenobacter sediminis]